MQITIGTKIKELRKANKYTQEDLANAIGVTPQAVSRWESGGSYPDVELIPSIANYFNVSIDALFGYEYERTRKINELLSRVREKNKVNNGVDTVAKGELFALLGVNGAGKTTTVKMLSCLSRPTGGNAFLLGESIVSSPNKVKGMIGVSPQETAVAPNLNVRENLELMCGLHGFSKEKTKEKLKELTELFELEKVSEKKAGKLSGGWQRKLSIALALISEAEILFLDEPTLGLDVFARRDLWNIIRALKEKITIILTTHYMEEAEELSDRVGIMKNGALIAVGTSEEIKAITGKDKFEDAFMAIITGDTK